MIRATTILAVRTRGLLAIVGDGQVSFGSTIAKPNAVKVRRLEGLEVITGFAGSTADCLTLQGLLEEEIVKRPTQLRSACVELAKKWRTDRSLTRLEATIIVADAEHTLLVTGSGDVMESHDGVMAIGSGGDFAAAGARAVLATQNKGLDARDIALIAMKVAADTCVYTNHNFTVQTISGDPKKGVDASN